MAVSKRLRYEILRRDNYACRYCGATTPDVKLVIDHVVPEALGGTNEPSNLVTACEPCNSGKTSSSPDTPVVEQVADDALRWAKAYAAATAGHRYERWERDQFRESFREAWERWTYDYRGHKHAFDLPVEWPLSVDALHDAGLDEEDLADAVDTTMRRRGVSERFRYFCGVCWNMVRARREIAGQILTDQSPDVVQFSPQPGRWFIPETVLGELVALALDDVGGHLDPWIHDDFVRRLAIRLLGEA